ncbi:MAG TPA: DinB family protein [Pseudonocardiaceae bacterium]|jgi:uncharacterized damage-inducible protein DinB|nr:DinB family protein [Pseudonocardiaceae bacterium]
MTEPVDPPLFLDELVSAGSEREVLETFLDLHRGIVRRKVTGLSEQDAQRRLVPSLTTLAGLVKHLAAVERGWFQLALAQRTVEQIGANPYSGDASWQVEPGETVAELVADYDRACAASREVAAGLELDDTVPDARMGRVSLRWIYVHMIEETARHAGQADILREQTDGATGADG